MLGKTKPFRLRDMPLGVAFTFSASTTKREFTKTGNYKTEQRGSTDVYLQEVRAEKAPHGLHWADGNSVVIPNPLSKLEAVEEPAPPDEIDRPAHYRVTVLASTIGDPTDRFDVEVECIDLMEALGLTRDFRLGSAFKYLWRWNAKGDPESNVGKALKNLSMWVEAR